MKKFIVSAACVALIAITAAALVAEPPGQATSAERNAQAMETGCPQGNANAHRSGGLVNIAPDGTGTTARERDCVVLSGTRKAAQVGRTIEVSDGAHGPASGPGISTADSASYALSLVNVRPGWPESALSGEADGLSVFVRQAKGDAAAFLANVGIRSGFAATLESYTFSTDGGANPARAVRTQLGVVNSRDGGEYGLVLQAADGKELSAGMRIASVGNATWKNYLEAVNPIGETVVSIRGSDGAIVGGDVLPSADLRKTLGTPTARYAATYSQVLQLAEAPFAGLPRCKGGVGGGTLAYLSDARNAPTSWGQVIAGGGSTYKIFVKCDGNGWTAL